MDPMTSFGQGGRGGLSESFPDPFLDIASLNMPTGIRSALKWCIPPGALIEMEGGQFKLIEDIIIGDRVLTRGGTIETVKETGVRQVDEEIVRLDFHGFGKQMSLRLTGDHKVWRIKTPKLDACRVIDKVTVAAGEKVCARDVKVGDFFATPLPRRDWSQADSQPPGWPAGESRFSGWLVGMYAAEGCLIRKADGTLIAAKFYCGEDDERRGILGEVVRRLGLETGEDHAAFTPSARPEMRVVQAYDNELPGWLQEHVPGRARDKHFGPAIFGYSDEFVLGLIGGLLDGDGCANFAEGKFKQAHISSASQVMLRQVQRLAYSLGMTPALCFAGQHPGWRTDAVTYSWVLSFGRYDCQRLIDYSFKIRQARDADPGFSTFTKAKKNSCFIRDGYVYHRVTRAFLEPYAGPVHSFEVNGDHSYIANGVTVANCEYIFMSMGTYRQAYERVLSYFITEIEFGDSEASDDEKDKWQEFLKEVLDVYGNIQSAFRSRMCYGNSFISILVPFKRWLSCPTPGCGSSFPLKEIHDHQVFKYAWSDMKFNATCPQCKKRAAWNIDDRPDDMERKIRLKHWNPFEIEILHDLFTDETAYLWRIPEDYKQQIKQGHLYHLERIPRPVLEAVRKNQMFRFNQDIIFHMKEPTLAGIRNRGWGLPRTLTNFRQIYYVQVLRRYNEAIALDYVIPFRLLTPAPRPGTGGGGGGQAQMADPMMAYNMGDFKSQMLAMIRKRRRDPASWHVLPFPVQAQMIGGDASKLAPVDLIANGTEQLLNDVGTPVDFYKGTLQLQTAPPALRLFEATWHPLVHDGNSFLRWLARQLAQILSWEPVKPVLKRVTISDDIQRTLMVQQLFAGQQLSGTTAFRTLGIDWKQEARRLGEETIYTAEQQEKIRGQLEQAGFAAEMAKGNMAPGGAGPQQPGQGGAPQGGGQAGQPMAQPLPVSEYIASMSPSTPVSPEDQMNAAEGLAQSLLGLPEMVKNQQLRELKNKNQAMHGVVKSKIEEIRRAAKNTGGAQVLAQQGGQPQ